MEFTNHMRHRMALSLCYTWGNRGLDELPRCKDTESHSSTCSSNHCSVREQVPWVPTCPQSLQLLLQPQAYSRCSLNAC